MNILAIYVLEKLGRSQRYAFKAHTHTAGQLEANWRPTYTGMRPFSCFGAL